MNNNRQNRLSEPICFSCRYYNNDYTCKAFPMGIPNEILLGENDHENPLPGQKNEIVFEPKSTPFFERLE